MKKSLMVAVILACASQVMAQSPQQVMIRSESNVSQMFNEQKRIQATDESAAAMTAYLAALSARIDAEDRGATAAQLEMANGYVHSGTLRMAIGDLDKADGMSVRTVATVFWVVADMDWGAGNYGDACDNYPKATTRYATSGYHFDDAYYNYNQAHMMYTMGKTLYGMINP